MGRIHEATYRIGLQFWPILHVYSCHSNAEPGQSEVGMLIGLQYLKYVRLDL